MWTCWILSTLSFWLTLPTTNAVETLTSIEVFEGIRSGRFDVVLDTRTPEEWEQGHLPNATFVDSLQKYNMNNGQITIPDDLVG